MIEQGIVELVQANAAVLAICPVGGFLVELPKDFAGLPSWTISVFGRNSPGSLQSTRGLVDAILQVDCYSNNNDGSDGLALGAAIYGVINGFAGTLPDVDSTFVSFCNNTDIRDFFDPDPRRHRRMLEFEIYYFS